MGYRDEEGASDAFRTLVWIKVMPLFEVGKAESGLGIKCPPGQRSGWSLDAQKPRKKGSLTPDWAPTSILLYSLLLLALPSNLSRLKEFRVKFIANRGD